MKRTYNTKVHSLRMSPDKITAFENACSSLPLSLKPNELLRGYIDYIIKTADDYRKNGVVKMGFLSLDGNFILINNDAKQTSINFDYEVTYGADKQ